MLNTEQRHLTQELIIKKRSITDRDDNWFLNWRTQLLRWRFSDVWVVDQHISAAKIDVTNNTLWAVSPKLSSVDFTVVKINWFTGPPAGHFMSPNLERTRSSHPIKWGNLIKQSDEQICIHFLEPQSHVAAALLYFKSVWVFFGLRDSLPFQNQISQPTAKTALRLPVMSKRIEIFFLGMHRDRVRP